MCNGPPYYTCTYDAFCLMLMQIELKTEILFTFSKLCWVHATSIFTVPASFTVFVYLKTLTLNIVDKKNRLVIVDLQFETQKVGIFSTQHVKPNRRCIHRHLRT